MPRTPIPIDMEQMEALLRRKLTREDCAAFFKVSVDTIERRIKDYTATEENPEGLTFTQFRDECMVHTRHDLIQAALVKAMGGDNTMLIFCLKNICGWRDRLEGEADVVINNTNIYEKMTDAELDQELAKLRLVGESNELSKSRE